MQSASLNHPVEIYDRTLDQNSSPMQTRSNTKLALVESAKTFAQVAIKFPYIVAYFSFSIPSVCTEFATGSVGAIAGGVVGSTAILARKCMGARARTFFGLEQPRSLLDYSVTGFQVGARLGELPGNFLGACTLLSLGATLSLNTGIALPLILSLSGVVAGGCALATFVDIKCCDVKHFSGWSENLLQNMRIREQETHDFLQGLDTNKSLSAAVKSWERKFTALNQS